MGKFMIVLVAVLLFATSALADVVTVEATGQVIWSGIGDPPLGDVNGGEQVVMSFSVDSDVFDEGTPGDTRGYVIDEASFSLSFSGGVEVGLMDPFPAGETPYFTLVDGYPVSDGFFVSTIPVRRALNGLLLEVTEHDLDLGYVEETLMSLDILDALGVYSFEGMTRFALNIWASFPDNVALECDFEMMIIDAPVATEEATWSDLKALFR